MKFTIKERTDRLIDRFSMVTRGQSVSLYGDSSEFIADIARDFRVEKHRARDILLRLAAVARRNAELLPSSVEQLQELQPDNPNVKGIDPAKMARELKEIEAEALSLVRG